MLSGSQLRWLFTTILAFCSPSDPRNLWNLFKYLICDDLKHHLQTRYHMQSPPNDQVHDFGLYLIDKILNQSGKSLDQSRDMPQVTGRWEEMVGNRFLEEQRDYDLCAELANAAENIARLNPGQKVVHDQILASVTQTDAHGKPCGRPFFVNGPGGTVFWNRELKPKLWC
jgi:hypothetical protein